MMEKATFAAGCFWGVQAEFDQLKGVVSTLVGYTGGKYPNPTYPIVCTGATGHAEAIEINFDPALLTYEQLLDKFWEIHDPTTLNRQGPDIGSQYRSAIFFHNPEQERLARKSKDALIQSGRFANPIVTQIVPAGEFYKAEEYHQHYLAKRGAASCRF